MSDDAGAVEKRSREELEEGEEPQEKRTKIDEEHTDAPAAAGSDAATPAASAGNDASSTIAAAATAE